MALILPTSDTCEKMREVFVLHHVLEKNLSWFFKIPSGLARNALGKKVVKTGENGFFVVLGKAVLERGKVVFGPPLEW
jgi:hypothetical protein